MNAGDVPIPGGDFRFFVQKLGYQALISMGILENPLTKERRSDLAQAKGVIEDLDMLRDKTRGNLSDEEAEHLDEVLRNIHGHFDKLSRG